MVPSGAPATAVAPVAPGGRDVAQHMLARPGLPQRDRWSVRSIGRGAAHDAMHARRRCAGNGRVVTLAALLLAVLGATGCATIGAPARWPGAEACTVDPTVVGTWTDRRLTQLGPAWTRLSLECDCRYAVRIRVLFMRIDERGDYRIADGAIRFARQETTTRWPYRVDGDQLAAHGSAGRRARVRPPRGTARVRPLSPPSRRRTHRRRAGPPG